MSCNQEIKNQLHRNQRDQERLNPTYGRGILGAFVFSIPGIIFWVLIANYPNALTSSLAFVIALLGYKGYTYFKGKIDQKTPLIISATNIVNIFIATITTLIVQLIADGLTLTQALQTLTNKDSISTYLVLPLFLSTVFCIISTIFIWNLINKENFIVPAKKIKTVKYN